MKLPDRIFFVALLLTAVTFTSCRGLLSDKPPIHPQQNMYFQERFNAQQENPFFEDGRAMRMPVEGTVARGQLRDDIGLYEGLNEDGDFIEENPLTLTREFLYRGKERYDIFCSMCHGGTGDGQGIIMAGQFGYVPAPTFHDDRIRELPDGEIYSAINNGVRTMPSYNTQIPVEDRWAIVAYVRALQQSQNVPEEEMEQFDVDLSELLEIHQAEQERAEALALAGERETVAEDEVSAELGERLYAQHGCQACHSTDDIHILGPTFRDLYGSEKTFEDGTTAIADEDYLHESIVDPSAKIVDGFQNVMPPYGHLPESEVQSLVEFIKTLSDN